MFKDPEEVKKQMRNNLSRINASKPAPKPTPKPSPKPVEKDDNQDPYLVIDEEGKCWCGYCNTHGGVIPNEIAEYIPNHLEGIQVQKEGEKYYFFCGLAGSCPYTASLLAHEESKKNE